MVIGMDIGSESNAMCFMDKEGRVIARYPAVYNSCRGFEFFRKTVEDTCARNGFTDFIIGMEPTGHYWRKIAFFPRTYAVRDWQPSSRSSGRALGERSRLGRRLGWSLHCGGRKGCDYAKA